MFGAAELFNTHKAFCDLRNDLTLLLERYKETKQDNRFDQIWKKGN